MATSTPITDSLFGISPEALIADRQAAQEAQAMQFAKLAPAAKATYGFARAGQLAGEGLGSLLGAQDPEMEAVKLVQQLGSKFDKTTPEGLNQLAQALQQTGNPYAQQFALQAADRARKLETDVLTQGKLKAEAAKAYREGMTTEQRNAGALADSKADRGTPEWTKIYNEELTRLTTKAEGAPKISKVGIAETTREPVYTYSVGNEAPRQVVFKIDANGNQVMVPYNGGVDQTTSKTNVGVKLPEGESEFVKKLGQLDARRVDEAISTRDNSVAALNSINRLAQLDDAGLISGTLASGRVGATNLLSTLGLVSGNDVNRLANSENYQKVAGDVILQTLGGKLGAGFSNEDRKFIQSLVPQLENSPQARRQLINFMREKNQAIIQETTRLENYARENRGLKGFEPKIPLAPQPVNAVQSLSNEELQRLIAERKKGK